MQEIQVRLFAAARAAAKTDELRVAPGSVAEILRLCGKGNVELQRVLPQCSVLIDGLACHDHQIVVAPGSQVDVLPRFAGG
ncbi:MAG: hypothetical protein AABY37_01275 [Actinomycetota bacterium]